MNNNNSFDYSKSSWLSRGFEQLATQLSVDPDKTFDVVIVGSGYGGAVAANTFAELNHESEDFSICILERGNEYLAGMFPHGFAEIPGHVRTDNQKEGLFDARLNEEVNTLVANGVGGGSLINAGVMEVPRPEVFEQGWPGELSNLQSFENFYNRARVMLGAGTEAEPNSIEKHPNGAPQKTFSLEGIAKPKNSFRYAAITVAMDDTTSYGNVALKKCLLCGDCATGCNHGAKNSLDLNLLVRAHNNGVQIYSGATVLSIEKDADAWIVNTVYTNAKLRKRLLGSEPIRIRTKKLVLAAGTLGSTEILLRSKSDDLHFSTRLGKQCSTNGDMLVTDYATKAIVNTVANENVKPSDRTVGPTITGIIDLREKHGVLIEELSVPAGIRRIFTEIFATTNSLHSLNDSDHSSHDNGFPDNDIYAVRQKKIQKTAVYAVMGDDGAGGQIKVKDGLSIEQDGTGQFRWDTVRDLPLFDKEINRVKKLTKETDGRVIPNPVWNLLPKNMEFLMDGERGPVITAHPLGGCVMADSVQQGVVDHLGRVFDPDSANSVHDGLVVLDGAVIPTALATNPALTIAAIALRASEALANHWGYLDDPPTEPPPEKERPVYRNTDYAFEPMGTTEFQVCERMFGPIHFKDADDQNCDCVVELTMRFEETPLTTLTYSDGDNPAQLNLDVTQDGSVTASRIRIYPTKDWNDLRLRHVPDRQMEDALNEITIYSAPLVSGKLRVFERRSSSQWSRFFRAGPAYLRNRGIRDTWQALFHEGGVSNAWTRFIGFFRLATRAGEVRWLNYILEIGEATSNSTLELKGKTVKGHKRFTYRRRANPWRQLLEMTLREFPGLRSNKPKMLDLDLRFLVRIGIPLFRITKQADGANALAELGSFFAYVVRLLVGIHIWSFRSPDPELDPHKEIDRLPGGLPDIPNDVKPEKHHLDIGVETPDGGGDAQTVSVLLTRYRQDHTDPDPDSTQPPVIMLHGYSASGTTFAHKAVTGGLASRFWNRGRDVWIADLRTSAGMPTTATSAWSMEQVAYRDIPEVFAYVHEKTGQAAEVVAHCMGAVMFSMGILHAPIASTISRLSPQHQQTLFDLPSRVKRVAFSQVGPLVVFTPANVFRAYAARYFREYLPDNYKFRPDLPQSVADQMLDRILATVPYPENEFDRENPGLPWARTEWVRTRHRMDALYGRDFNVLNIGDDVLDYIDDHFGPLSIKTVTQTIHFNRYSTITDATGYNSFVSRSNLTDANWHFPVLSVHGEDNGLADVSTVDRMKQILGDDAGRHFESHIIDDAGHQDCLIGHARHEMADKMLEFFDDESARLPGAAKENLVAYTPWIGPIFTSSTDPGNATIRIGAGPVHRAPEAAVMLRVQISGSELRRHSDGLPFDAGDENFVLQNMVMYTSPDFRRDRWDAFDMPKYPAVPAGGDGLLVLIVYAESPILNEGTLGYRSVLAGGPGVPLRVTELNPPDWRPQGPVSRPAVTVGEMREIARAALRKLVAQYDSGVKGDGDGGGDNQGGDDPVDRPPGELPGNQQTHSPPELTRSKPELYGE